VNYKLWKSSGLFIHVQGYGVWGEAHLDLGVCGVAFPHAKLYISPQTCHTNLMVRRGV
jgi:hypothetical protein